MRVQVSSCQPAGRPAPTAASPVSNATACTVAGLHSARPRARARADERTPRRTDSASQGCGYRSAREQAATHHRSMPDRSRARRRTDCRRTATPSHGAVLHRRQQGSPRCTRWHPASHRPEPSPRRPHRGTAECLAAQIVSRVGRVRLPNVPALSCNGQREPRSERSRALVNSNVHMGSLVSGQARSWFNAPRMCQVKTQRGDDTPILGRGAGASELD